MVVGCGVGGSSFFRGGKPAGEKRKEAKGDTVTVIKDDDDDTLVLRFPTTNFAHHCNPRESRLLPRFKYQANYTRDPNAATTT